MKPWLIATSFLLLAACQEAPSGYTPATIDFSNQPPISLNVAEIRIADGYHSPVERPNVEHEFPTPPEVAVKKWIGQRLKAVGTQGFLEISIDDASVKETLLPKTAGVRGLFTNDQDARYDASIQVTMKLYNGVDALSVVHGDVHANRSRSIDEKATVEDHERLYDAITHEIMHLFNTSANERLHTYFSAYIR